MKSLFSLPGPVDPISTTAGEREFIVATVLLCEGHNRFTTDFKYGTMMTEAVRETDREFFFKRSFYTDYNEARVR